METPLSEKQSTTLTNKCSACGAMLEYDIESGNLKCSHCGSVTLIEANDKVERRQMTDTILKEHTQWNENSVYRCNGCGAKQALDKKDITRLCPFCGSSNVVSIDELPGIKPDSVIPFQITKQNAIERFKRWIKSRWFAPRSLKKSDTNEHLNALYMSSWSFSAQTENTYSGTLGRRVTTYRQERGPNGQMITKSHTEIRWFSVNGNINETYLDYKIQSGDKIPSVMFNKMKPFDNKFLKVYRQEYLSGIIAEHYSRNLDVCFNEFANYIRADLRRKIMARHNADVAGNLNINLKYKDRKFNYILLPVYIANYLYNRKNYNFYVNGASGIVVGKYPKSKLKIALISIGIGILAVGAVISAWFLGLFDGSGDI